MGNHAPLKENEAMLFVFPAAGFHSFWMKDMTFDLDFIWINNNRIVDLTENVSHVNQTQIYMPKTEVDNVLEVNAGFIQMYGIKIGDKVSL